MIIDSGAIYIDYVHIDNHVTALHDSEYPCASFFKTYVANKQ